MQLLIIIALAGGLAATLVTLFLQRRRIQELYDAVRNKRLYIEDSEHRPAQGSTWRRLTREINELTEEVNRLHEIRSGQLAQLQATLGSLQEGVLMVDASNRILLVNRALEAIFVTAHNMLGQRLEQVLQGSGFLEYVSQVRRGDAAPRREIEFTQEGRSRWVEVTGSIVPALDGTKQGWLLFVVHDVTRQKNLEAVRKDFVANVSHELRTPLSVIKGYVETLVDGHHEMPLQDRDRFLGTIQRHTDRLNSLLDDLLLLSRLESINPGLRREPTELAALLQGVVDDFRQRPAAAGHTITATFEQDLGKFAVDPLRLTQAIENLVDNAVKYSPKGSVIAVHARKSVREVEISVADTGPGIPAADLPHIFERFYRVDKGRSRDKGGTGLGLSIVKHIVQLHGGISRVESQVGRGTTFYISLPCEAKGERHELRG